MLNTTGTKKQRGDGGEDQATDHRAAERRILLTAFAQANAIGSMPITMASAVIITGRRRTNPASTAACVASPKLAELLASKTDDEHAVRGRHAMHMIAPVSAGTDSVVCVAKSIQIMPASAAGSAVMMTKGSLHDWKLINDQQIDQHDCAEETEQQSGVRRCSWSPSGRPRRRLHLSARPCRFWAMIFWILETAPRSRPWVVA